MRWKQKSPNVQGCNVSNETKEPEETKVRLLKAAKFVIASRFLSEIARQSTKERRLLCRLNSSQ